MGGLECKGYSLKVKWSHTVSAQSAPIYPHEEVRKLNAGFQIDPIAGPGTTFYVIETSACAQIRSVLSLGVSCDGSSHHK